MKLRLVMIALGMALGALAPEVASACGDYCGLYNTTGYLGYDLGTSMYGISSYTSTTTVTVTDDYGYGGGCGSFVSSCGGSMPSMCSDGCGVATPYDMYLANPMAFLSGGMNPGVSPMNPMTFPGTGSFMDPTQMMMPSTLGYPFTPPFVNPISSVMPPQMFPPVVTDPFSMFPFPGVFPPGGPNPMNPSLLPFQPPLGPMYPTVPPYTNPFTNPSVPFGNPVPPVNNPVPTNPISPPPPTVLPWGGCDNVVVMCPTGSPTRPTTTPVNTPVPTPLAPPFSVQPQYQTSPTDPTRFQVPRNSH